MRLHLLEFHDQPWCPAVVRDGVRAVLQQFSSTLPGYEAAAESLLDAMARSGTTEVVDLCSGAGGPWVRMLPAARQDPRIERVLLTDLFPDPTAMASMQARTSELTQPWPDSVDATAVPSDLPGFRTVFNAFHHFRPDDARRVLADAVASGQGIGVFELTERRLPATTFVSLAAMPLALVLLPLVRPFRWSYALLTYVVPIIPWMLAFDGMVSCLRTYHPEELLQMAREVGPDYAWEAGRIRAPGGPLAIVYLVGVPPQA